MAIITGFPGNNPLLQGSPVADEIYGNGLGNIAGIAGSDRIFGLGGDDRITGDGVNILATGRGGNDLIQGGDGQDIIYGDAFDAANLFGGTLWGIGGNDVIEQNAGDGSEISGVADLAGDAYRIGTGVRGGDDSLYVGSGEGAVVTGDASSDAISAILGNDLIDATGAAGTLALLGDVAYGGLFGNSTGGRDTIKGSAFTDENILGDGDELHDLARGGNDQLWGNGGGDRLFGDGFELFDQARGGNDVLRGGSGDDTIVGDGDELADFSKGGNDRLIGGAGDDELWGDGALLDDAAGGKDRFVFAGSFGDDAVFDFRTADGDVLVFQGVTQSEVTQTIITAINPNDSLQLTTLGGDSVTLVGFTGGLTPGVDIVFA